MKMSKNKKTQIKKSYLKKYCDSLQYQLEKLTAKTLKLEEQLQLLEKNNSPQLSLYDNLITKNCKQCGNDLSKLQSCMSVNCPYSFKVTC